MQSQLKTYLKTGGTSFILGILVREIVIFIKEGGLTDQFTLARALFIIVSALAALLVLWADERFETVERRIGSIATPSTRTNEFRSSSTGVRDAVDTD